MANRHLGTDCYDLTCTVGKSLGIAGDDDALGVLWLIGIGVLVLAALAPFVWWMPRRRRL